MDHGLGASSRAHPPRAETHEPAKGGQVTDLADSPNIAFDVNLQVVSERLRGIRG